MRYLRRFLVPAVLFVFAGTVLSQPVSPDSFRNSKKVMAAFREVVAKPSEATVRVLADGKEVCYGAVVEPDGWIITKWSVIDGKKVSVKLKDGKVLKADVKGVKDEDGKDFFASYDIAMLKVDAKGLPAVQWRNSKETTVGKWVASVGVGADPIAVGVVSVAARKLAPGDQPPKFFNPKAGYLGVQLAQGMGGAKVTKVDEGTPAFKAGLKVDDLIYEAAGRKIARFETLIETIGRFNAGEKVMLKVKRGEEDKNIEVTLGQRPKQLQGNPQETMGTTLSIRRGGFPVIIQHDSGVHPNDCGGPLVDLDGKTVGINIARAGRTETYAIPAEDIQKLIPDLKSGKLAPKSDPVKVATTPNTGDFEKQFSFGASDKLDKDRPKLVGKRFARVEEVKLSAGVTYIITMSTTADKLDPYLILEDDKGNKLAEDDDGLGFPNAKIVFTPKADGVYRIICTTFNPNETGAFTLGVRKQAAK